MYAFFHMLTCPPKQLADVLEGQGLSDTPSCVWTCWQQACVTHVLFLAGIFNSSDWNLVAVRFRHWKVNFFKCAAENGIIMSFPLGWYQLFSIPAGIWFFSKIHTSLVTSDFLSFLFLLVAKIHHFSFENFPSNIFKGLFWKNSKKFVIFWGRKLWNWQDFWRIWAYF